MQARDDKSSEIESRTLGIIGQAMDYTTTLILQVLLSTLCSAFAQHNTAFTASQLSVGRSGLLMWWLVCIVTSWFSAVHDVADDTR